MDMAEESLLARVTVNYLFLGQYETFRASLKTLGRKNPAIAIAILQAVVQKVGDIKGISWSKSITSPSHLTWLALSQSFELQACLPPEKRDSVLWGLDYNWLKLKLEAVFLLHQIIKAVEAKVLLLAAKSTSEVGASPSSALSSSSAYPATVEDPDISSLLDGSPQSGRALPDLTKEQSYKEGLHMLKQIYNAWFALLSLHLEKSEDTQGPLDHLDEEMAPAQGRLLIEQRHFLQQATVIEPELFNALCWNIVNQEQLNKHIKVELSGRDTAQIEGINTSGKSAPSGFDSILHQEVQGAFLAVLKKNLDNSSLQECLKYLPLLQNDFGVPDQTYRDVIYAIVKKTMSQECGISKQDRLRMAVFELYEAIQASGSAYLVSAVQSAQDSFLHEAAESNKTATEPTLPPPLHYLHQCFRCLRGEDSIVSQDAGLNEGVVLRYCLRQLCHYSRVTGAHMFDMVMDAALSAIKTQQFQKAVDILAIFPRLQPLAAVIGWDLLAGDTAARRLMMEYLWASKSIDSPTYIKHGDEFCCVDHLCDQLCHRLDLAYFAAHINSGLEWTTSFFLYPYQGWTKSNKKLVDTKPADAFVANLVLERLAMHSPIRVLFDVVPDVKLKHARALLKMCPVASGVAECMRMQDLEILEVHFGIQAIVLALGAMERCMIDGGSEELGMLAMSMLGELRDHMLSISNVPRRIFFMSIVVDLLHMDDASSQSLPSGLETKLKSLLSSRTEDAGTETARKITTIDFVRRLLGILRECMFSSVIELEDQKMECAFPKGFMNLSGQKAWEWKNSNLSQFIEDWEWRLAVLQRLAPSPHRQWQWKEALAVLRAAPSTLLNLCVQRAQYDLGEEAVHRFALPPEDEAALQLAEWVDGAVARASVDDAVSRVAEGASSPEEALKLAALRAPLAPLANVLLCIDVAAASARAVDMSKQLLYKARSLLTEITSARQGSNQAEQIQEACILSVGKRVVQCLQDLLEKICVEKNQTLQSLLSGTDMVNVVSETAKHGHRYRALNMLQQTIEDAHNGKRQFLSGKLHNLVKALADEDIEENNLRPSVSYAEKKLSVATDNGFLLGHGVRGTSKQPTGVMAGAGGGDHVGETTFFPLKGTGKRYLGPLISKPLAYLSAFILYIATIGDIVDGVDTTHDFNFFTLVYERSNDLLTRLVFERGNANAAGKVAEIMGADLAQEVISACVPPIYPPKSSRGWACIPLLPTRFTNSDNQHDRASNNLSEHDCGLYPLKLDVVKHLATLSPVRAILACVFGTSRFRKTARSLDGNVGARDGNGFPSMDTDRSFYEFALDQSDRFSTLNRWIQTQANLQQLSEFPLSTKKGNMDGQQKLEANRALLKRSLEHESDTESEEDEEKRVFHGVQSSNHSM
eukprot:c24544_g1_i1 orf=3-4136(-)